MTSSEPANPRVPGGSDRCSKRSATIESSNVRSVTAGLAGRGGYPGFPNHHQRHSADTPHHRELTRLTHIRPDVGWNVIPLRLVCPDGPAIPVSQPSSSAFR